MEEVISREHFESATDGGWCFPKRKDHLDNRCDLKGTRAVCDVFSVMLGTKMEYEPRLQQARITL